MEIGAAPIRFPAAWQTPRAPAAAIEAGAIECGAILAARPRAPDSMPSVHKSVLLAHSAEQMFDLVQAVERYPQFLPWCGGSTVHERSLHRMLATVQIDYRGIRQSFTTENTLHAPHRIGMTLREGPFSRLDGLWHFHTLRHDACKVEFRLDYAFKSGLLGQALVPVFDHIARSFVDAFVRRADQLQASGAAAAPSAAAATPGAAPPGDTRA